MRPARRAQILLVAAAACVFAKSAPVLAQNQPRAREDDVEFALKLADRNYEELALREVERMAAGEQKEYTRCQLLRRTALLAAGNPRSEPSDVREKFGAAGKAFDAFLKAYASSRLKSEAEFNMANLMKDFAYYLTNNKDKFPAAEQEGVVKEANKTFDDAIKYLQTIKQREQERADAAMANPPDNGQDPDREAIYLDRNIAWYYLCTAMHDRAMLLPAGDALRTQQLTQAIDQTILLLEETDGTIFGYLAGKLLGLQFWHRAEMKKGFSAADIRQSNEHFGSPIDAVDTYNDIENDWPQLVNVLLETTVEYGKMCNAVGTLEGVHYPKMFVAKVEELEQKIPGSMKGKRFGLEAIVEKSKSLAALGSYEAAIQSLNKVINLAAGGDPAWAKAVEQIAKRGLNEVLAAIPADAPVTLAPEVLVKAGEGSLRDGAHGRAIRAFQRALVAIDAEPDSVKRRALADAFEVKCWSGINDAYVRMERYLEAFLAADVPVQRYLAGGKKGDFDAVGWLAYYRKTALASFLKVAPKEVQPKYADLLRAANELITKEFAGHESSTGTTYSVASSRLDQAAGLMAAGETQRATEMFQAAIDDFAKVDAKDALHHMAQARIGQALVQMGKPAEGLKHLQGLVAKNQAEWSGANFPASQKRAWGWSLFWMAMAFDDQKQPAKVVEMLADFEKRFAGAGLEPTYPRVRFTRINALCQAARGPEAEKECAALMKDSGESAYSTQAALVVANDLKVRSERSRKEGNKKASLESLTRAAELYDYWIRRSSSAGADDLTFVGSLFAEIGDVARAAEHWEKALAAFSKEGKAREVETITVDLAGLLVGEGKYAEALPKFEELFIKTPDDLQPLREVFDWLRMRPSNVAQAVHDKAVKDTLTKVAEALSKDPAGAAGVGEAKKAAATGETEPLVRAYADSPELRRALARAAALTMLGTDAAMPAERRNAVLALVKRAPNLMANLARCYEELSSTSDEFPIRAVNLYSTLIEGADDPEGDAPQPGQKYSERWFEWKWRWIQVYLNTGIAYKHEVWLKIVCDLVRSMEVKDELLRANKERMDFSKQFESLRDKADSALRGLGKEGCK